MTGSATFHCPFCGAPIAGSHPGATFACPYCRAKVVAPGAGGMPSFDRHEHAPSGPFSGGSYSAVVAFDPRAGFLAIGGHAPVGEPARLRAWDLRAGRSAWEALSGQGWLEDTSRDELWVRGSSVYVANRRQLVALDLASGAQRWVATLSDVASDIADAFPAGGRGAILVSTIDHHLFALDRDAGHVLWHRSFGDKDLALQAVEGMGVCVVRWGSPYVKVDLVSPGHPQPIASLGHDHWSTDLGLARVAGRSVVTVAEDMGGEGDEEGLLGFDAVTGQRHFFDRVEDLEHDDVAPCAMGPRVFAATSDKHGIYVGPKGRRMPSPVPSHEVAAFCAAGPTLAILLRKAHGTPVRRVIGIDPQTLAFRFDAGEAGSEPDDAWERQMATDGWSLVFVAALDDDRHELRSVDTTSGRRLWSRALDGRWVSHRFLGGHLVVRTEDGLQILAPSSGEPIASLSG